MKRYTIFVLMMLLASSTLLAVMPAGAQGVVVHGDRNDDKIVSDEEMGVAEQSYKDGKITSDQLEEIRHIHENYPRTIVCDPPYGKEVTIYKPINRIIVLSTYGAEAIRSLKATDKVVGIPNYLPKQHSLFFPVMSKVPDVGSGFEPDIEKVLSLEPDIILAFAGSCPPERLEEQLEGTDVVVVRLGFSKASYMIEDFRKLGYILEKEDEAEDVIDFYEEFNSKIEERVGKLSEEEKPKVYFESIWTHESEYKAIGNGVGIDDLCTMVGGINIADFDQYRDVDPEWVIMPEQNPDIIIGQTFTGIGCGYEHDDPSNLEAVRAKIMNRDELANVTAVKNGAIYCISIQVTSKPRYFVGAACLAKWFYPELFDDLDPEAMNKEYLERFQGMPYRGIYAYPPPEES